MKTKTKRILTILNVTSWIIFLGLCVKTGAILYSFFVSLVLNPPAAENLHLGLDLSNLYQHDTGHYTVVVSLIIFLSGLKAYLFYLVVRIFMKINFVHPFSTEVSVLISRISYVAIGIGLLTFCANGYCAWLTKQGVVFPDLQNYLGGAGEFLLLGAIIFMISQVFRKGIEIQSENDLTV
ncbi:MAG TPA: DUF2975 domain-containing protein [Parafilimonas sp.]|nr:DUF2975 domain-containing protein [Parafilimonas sp.]